MSTHRTPRFMGSAQYPGRARAVSRCRHCRKHGSQQGFTLVELLIVVTIIPVIIGGLSLALMSVFKLQTSVSSRLSNSGDAQAVAVNYRNDVQSAQYVTTQTSSTPQCGSGNQLLGLEWDLDSTTGVFQTRVSYVAVPVTSGSTTTYSLVREYCTSASSNPTSITTVSYNLITGQVPPVLAPTSADTASKSAWISAQGVTTISLAITQPEGQGTYQYTLVGAPATAASAATTGTPITQSTTTHCNFATSGGTYAATLCFVDFAALNSVANMTAATSGCLEMSVALPQNYTMYFCIHLSGGYVQAVPLPTYSQAFLGNNVTGVPFYFGVPGSPAIYQPYGHNGETPTTISLTGITVVNPPGVNATGWEFVGADAETSDYGESISFSSDQTLNLLNNSPTSPVGNACGATAPTYDPNYVTGVGTTTIACTPPSNETSAVKTGTLMVWALTPSTFTGVLNGGAGGLEGLSFGLLLS